MRKTIHAIVSGKVQGVCYRDWAVDKASSLGVDGWVRNRSDGTVEAMFSGEEATLQAMLAACRDGPPAAQVIEVTATETSEATEKGFKRLPTL